MKCIHQHSLRERYYIKPFGLFCLGILKVGAFAGMDKRFNDRNFSLFLSQFFVLCQFRFRCGSSLQIANSSTMRAEPYFWEAKFCPATLAKSTVFSHHSPIQTLEFCPETINSIIALCHCRHSIFLYLYDKHEAKQE